MSQVKQYTWGDDVAALSVCPDLITGADIVYQEEHFEALLTSLGQLAAPHTLIFLSYRLRGMPGILPRQFLLCWLVCKHTLSLFLYRQSSNGQVPSSQAGEKTCLNICWHRGTLLS